MGIFKSKKEFLYIFIVFLISVFCSIYFFKSNINVFLSQDLTFHLNRFVGLAKAFEEGQILPKIYPYTNNGFGYASPLFYCDLFLYPFALLYHFGLGAVYCYKLCVFFYSFLSALFIYKIFKKETDDNLLSYVAVILYMCANYRLQNIYIRSALGEILAMTFIPLVLHSIYKILVKHEGCYIYLGVSFSLLLMAHLITTFLYGIFFFCMIIVFIIINRKDKELLINTFKTILKGTILALLLTCWYLFPMLEQLNNQTFWLSINAKYNNIANGVQSINGIFSLFALSDVHTFSIMDDASVGLALFIPLFCYPFVEKNKYVSILLSCCLISYLILIGIIPGAFLNIIQFYFRLYIIIFPLFVIIDVYIIKNIVHVLSRKIFISILIILSFLNVCICVRELNKYTRYLSNNASIEEINSINSYMYDLDYNHDELGGAEYLPYTEYVNYNDDSLAIKYIDKSGEVIDYVYDYDRLFTCITFSCDNDKELELMLPLSYYKGYSAYEIIDEKEIKIDLTYSPLYKELVIISSSGKHTYKVLYEGTFVQKISLIVSCLTFVGVIKRKRADVI